MLLSTRSPSPCRLLRRSYFGKVVSANRDISAAGNGNQISGTLPSTLGSLISLQVLCAPPPPQPSRCRELGREDPNDLPRSAARSPPTAVS